MEAEDRWDDNSEGPDLKMPQKLIDRSGEKIGRLIVIRPIRVNPTWFECLCDCGNIVNVRTSSLRVGATKSCGCLHREIKTRHGLRHRPEYFIWKSIKQRCLNPHNKQYADYGGRGITIHSRWADSFAEFIAAVGYRPHPSLSLDRIDNQKGYEPGNVRWTTSLEQNNNSRKNTILMVDGQEMTLAQAARSVGIPQARLSHRLRYGWSLSQALSPNRCNRWDGVKR
jgi:hypothetical protein